MARTGLGRAPSLTVIIGVPKPKRRMAEGTAVADPLLQGGEEGEEEEDEDEEEGDEQEIVAEAARALRGESRNPEMALREFVATFGRPALEELRQMVLERGEARPAPAPQPAAEEALPPEEEAPVTAARGRLMRGNGGGLDDTISARNGDQDVLLSDGEFVVPADVVSMLGDGSTDAGARVLEKMMARVRHQKTGRSKQAKALKHGSVLPA